MGDADEIARGSSDPGRTPDTHIEVIPDAGNLIHLGRPDAVAWHLFGLKLQNVFFGSTRVIGEPAAHLQTCQA